MSIIVDKVSHIYGKGTAHEQLALHNVSFVVPKGQFVGIIGHTGSGKSTLIQHLNGLLKPDSGSVYFEGADIFDKDYDRRALRGKVGLVFQYPEHQLFEADVFSDVCFGPKNMGLDRREAELKAFEALRMVKFPEELFYHSPFELSGGQKRRAAIAGVLAMNPSVMILDEPTAGLDPRGRDEILDLIAELRRKKNMTIFLVSHSMEDVAKYADRLLVMNKGELAFDGEPKAVFAHYKELEEMGLAAPLVTYVMHDLKEKGYSVDTGASTVEEARDSILKAFHFAI